MLCSPCWLWINASCFSLLSTGITGVHRQAWQYPVSCDRELLIFSQDLTKLIPSFAWLVFPKQSDFRFPIYICIYVTIVTCIKPFCVCLPCRPLGSHSFLYLPLFIHPTNLFLSACLSQAWEQLTPRLRRDEWSGERLLPQWMLGC